MTTRNSLRKDETDPGGDFNLRKIKKGNIPRHVAIIMDGNGRWARRRGLPRLAGHRAGVKNVSNVLGAAQDAGVEYLTLYTFSVENWQRPADEIAGLMQLLKETVASELAEIHEKGVKVNIIGRWRELPADVVAALDETVELTKNNTRGVVTLALNYGGRTEIVDAVRDVCRDVREGALAPEAVEHANIAGRLYTAGMPDPDLLIRTSGELRVSNFLLWQIAYTEIWVTPVFWPDFSRRHFFDAILDFQARRRRYGGLDDDVEGGGRA